MKKPVPRSKQTLLELDRTRLANAAGGHNPNGQAKDTPFAIQSPSD